MHRPIREQARSHNGSVLTEGSRRTPCREAFGFGRKAASYAIPVRVSLLTKAASSCRIFSGCTGLFSSKLAPTMVRCWLKDRGARHAERPLGLAEGLRLRNTCGSELAHESGIQLQDIQRMHRPIREQARSHNGSMLAEGSRRTPCREAFGFGRKAAPSQYLCE